MTLQRGEESARIGTVAGYDLGTIAALDFWLSLDEDRQTTLRIDFLRTPSGAAVTLTHGG